MRCVSSMRSLAMTPQTVRSSGTSTSPRACEMVAWGSKSTTSTRYPSRAAACAKWRAVVLFPAPPLKFAIATLTARLFFGLSGLNFTFSRPFQRERILLISSSENHFIPAAPASDSPCGMPAISRNLRANVLALTCSKRSTTSHVENRRKIFVSSGAKVSFRTSAWKPRDRLLACSRLRWSSIRLPRQVRMILI